MIIANRRPYHTPLDVKSKVHLQIDRVQLAITAAREVETKPRTPALLMALQARPEVTVLSQLEWESAARRGYGYVNTCFARALKRRSCGADCLNLERHNLASATLLMSLERRGKESSDWVERTATEDACGGGGVLLGHLTGCK